MVVDPISGELMDSDVPIIFFEEEPEPEDPWAKVDPDDFFFDPTHIMDMEDNVKVDDE